MGKRKSSMLWMETRRKDQYYKLAKERGYRSRASFKLLETIHRYRFVKPGDRVVDIGAAPGGWLQATRHTVGDKGFVYGFDIEPMKPLPHGNVLTQILDVTSEGAVETIAELVGEKVNAVLSDVAPNISGVWDVDHARQIFLAGRSLDVARRILVKGGNFFVKLFHGPELNELKRETQKDFRNAQFIKPLASRSRSSEIYLLCTGFMG